MSHSGFTQLSKSSKKKVVKGFLSKIPRNSIRSNIDIKKKERVLVNPKGNYGLDNTVFDQEIKMPKHLIDEKHRDKGVLSG